MTELYDSIPPERQAEYLQNAEGAFNEAIEDAREPVIKEMTYVLLDDTIRGLKEVARHQQGIEGEVLSDGAQVKDLADEVEDHLKFVAEYNESPDGAAARPRINLGGHKIKDLNDLHRLNHIMSGGEGLQSELDARMQHKLGEKP